MLRPVREAIVRWTLIRVPRRTRLSLLRRDLIRHTSRAAQPRKCEGPIVRAAHTATAPQDQGHETRGMGGRFRDL